MGAQRACSQGIWEQRQIFCKKGKTAKTPVDTMGKQNSIIIKLFTVLLSEVIDFVTSSEIFSLKQV